MASTDGHGPLLVAQSEVMLPVDTDGGVLLGVALREYTLDLRAGLLTALAFTPTHLRLAFDAATAEAVWLGVAPTDPSRVFMRWLAPVTPDGQSVESTFFFRRPTAVGAPVTCILHLTSVSVAGHPSGPMAPAFAGGWPLWAGGGAAAVGACLPPSPPPSLRTLTHPLLYQLTARLVGTRMLVVRPGLASTHAGSAMPGGVAADYTAVYSCSLASDVTALRQRLAAAVAFAPTSRWRREEGSGVAVSPPGGGGHPCRMPRGR